MPNITDIKQDLYRSDNRSDNDTMRLLKIFWTWSNSSDNKLSHYRVLFDDGSVQLIHTTSTSFFADASNHTLRLQAVDMCGQESGTVTRKIAPIQSQVESDIKTTVVPGPTRGNNII